jgi:hypothetical protein
MSNLLFCTDLRSDFDRLHGRKAGAFARYPGRLRATRSTSSSRPHIDNVDDSVGCTAVSAGQAIAPAVNGWLDDLASPGHLLA